MVIVRKGVPNIAQKFPIFVLNLELAKKCKLKTITLPILTNHTRPQVFSCPMTVDRLVKTASVPSFRAGMAQKSIKTYFLKGKAHESGNCRNQIEKMQLYQSKSNRKTHQRPNNPEWTGMHKKIILNPLRYHQSRPTRRKRE